MDVGSSPKGRAHTLPTESRVGALPTASAHSHVPAAGASPQGGSGRPTAHRIGLSAVEPFLLRYDQLYSGS